MDDRLDWLWTMSHPRMSETQTHPPSVLSHSYAAKELTGTLKPEETQPLVQTHFIHHNLDTGYKV